MTERTTDPDAGRLPTIAERDDADLLELYAQLRARLCMHQCAGNVHVAHDEARDELAQRFASLRAENAALRERAERAEALAESQGAMLHAKHEEFLRVEARANRRRDEIARLRAALEGARALVKSAWCEGHNIGLGDGHPLAGPPHRWEDSDACADLAALSVSPAPEVRDATE